jgi:hypothetical protein
MDKQSVCDIVEKLLVIQEQDCRIARCRLELNDLPKLRHNSVAKLDLHKSALEKAGNTIKTRLVAVNRMEVEIESMRQQIVKLREQQFQIKSNDEFKVLNREIAAVQEKIRGLEDSAIELMESAEQARQEESQLKSELAGAEAHVRDELAQYEERAKKLNAEVAQIQQDREKHATDIPADWLNHYNRVMENRKDAALVGIENKSCGGCHIKLPPHVLQDVKRADAIVTCSFCGRLLYWRS